MLAVTSSLHEGRDGRAQLVVRIEGDVSMSTLPKLTDFLNRELAAETWAIARIDSGGVQVPEFGLLQLLIPSLERSKVVLNEGKQLGRKGFV